MAVIAHHLMWTAYGWWLPNDPRGSTSAVIRNDWVRELAELHFGRKAAQPAGRDLRAFYAQAAAVLKHPLLEFSRNELPSAAGALGHAVKTLGYMCYGCAVMPDHTHILIRRHRHQAEKMIEGIQKISREHLVLLGLRSEDHPVWTRGGWKAFLNSPDDIQRTIRYIQANPVRRNLPAQSWDWVSPYDGWPYGRLAR